MNDNSSTSRPRRLIAEIISIGDEISSGAILDTNSQYLSESLTEIGVRTLYHTTIGDDMSAMESAFALAFRRADVVICTGGLGPTQDDLTRQAAANVLGVELVFDEQSFEHTKKLFERRGRAMPESNRIQAYFPRGSSIIFNPNGTAPGFIIESTRDSLPDFQAIGATLTPKNELRGEFIALFFPGVPAEMKEMWRGDAGRAAVDRYVRRVGQGKSAVFRTKLIHSFGLGESAVEARLPNLIAREHYPNVGITAKNSVITLRIFAEGASEAVCNEQISEISKTIYDAIGGFVFGEDDETFAEVFSRNLRAQSKQVGLFEWGTQGALARLLESDVLAFGCVFGANDSALFKKFFGDSNSPSVEKKVDPRQSETFGASFYSEDRKVSAELLKLGRELSLGRSVDYYLSIGPYPTTLANVNAESAAPQTVDVAFVDLRESERPFVHRETFAFGGQPAMIDALFCNRAMSVLLKNQ